MKMSEKSNLSIHVDPQMVILILATQNTISKVETYLSGKSVVSLTFIEHHSDSIVYYLILTAITAWVSQGNCCFNLHSFCHKDMHKGRFSMIFRGRKEAIIIGDLILFEIFNKSEHYLLPFLVFMLVIKVIEFRSQRSERSTISHSA